MGLFGLFKKKEATPPAPDAKIFRDQRLDAVDPEAVYRLMRNDSDSVVKNPMWFKGSTSFEVLTIGGGIWDIRNLGKRLGVNEEGMDPIPAKQSRSYYNVYRYQLNDYAADKGSAKAAILSFFMGMMNSNDDSIAKAEEKLKYGCGPLGEKYEDIIARIKKNMMGTAADVTQQESFVVTACHILRQPDPSQLNEASMEIYKYAHELLNDEEYEAMAYAAGYALFCMGNNAFVKHPSATLRLGKILATRDESFFKETYGMRLLVSDDMLELANIVVEPAVLKAREGDPDCINACKLWGVY